MLKECNHASEPFPSADFRVMIKSFGTVTWCQVYEQGELVVSTTLIKLNLCDLNLSVKKSFVYFHTF